MLDEVTLVNEQDQVIGSMDKIEAHRGSGKLHRAISIFLFRTNEKGEKELLVQQRSQKKIVGALQWANTVCGNVWPGESYEECAKRRLDFELGITDQVPLTDIYTFRYQVPCNQEFSENEIDHIFAGEFNSHYQPNPEEVRTTQWISWKKVKELDDMFQWAPWFEKMMKDAKVTTVLERNAK